MDAYYPDYNLHPPMTMVGDGKTGMWKRHYGFIQPERLLTMIDELKALRLAKLQ